MAMASARLELHRATNTAATAISPADAKPIHNGGSLFSPK